MKYNKSPFKWAGSKQKALDNILPIINSFDFEVFAEPFVGAANVSLNVEADNYLWNDLNKDLIYSYRYMLRHPEDYIKNCQKWFDLGFDEYYKLRDRFNSHAQDNPIRSELFQYLNKFGFNGLCRYNGKGKFNVPVGTLTKTPKKVPVEQIRKLKERHHNKVDLFLEDYESFFIKLDIFINKNTLVYCDSPYVPLTSEFKYTADGFNEEDHIKLKECTLHSKHTVLISNHWTEFTEQLYSDADEIHLFDVQRTISCKGDQRKKVKECLVIYNEK